MIKKLKDITYPAIFVAVITVCAWIYIPFSVPFTLQTFAVFVAAGLLGTKKSISAILVYIALGALGVPVFSGFRGGVGALLGNTGGYILGFIFIALSVGIFTHFFGRKPPVLVLSMLVGLIICYAFGTAWFLILYTRSGGTATLGAVLSWCVVPFIVPDLIKLVLATLVTVRLDRTLNGKHTD